MAYRSSNTSPDPFQDSRSSVPSTPGGEVYRSSLVAERDGRTIGGVSAVGGGGGTREGISTPEPNKFIELGTPSALGSRSFVGSLPNTPDPSRPFLLAGDSNVPIATNEKQRVVGNLKDQGLFRPQRSRWRLLWIIFGILVAVIVIVLAITLPVVLTRSKRRSSSAQAGVPASNPHSPTGATTGGDGSQVVTSDGVTFTYNNSFGGYCEALHFVYDVDM